MAYQGILPDGKIVWKRECESCGGILETESIEGENPVKELVRRILINYASAPKGVDSDIQVIKEFLTLSKDHLQVFKESLIEQDTLDIKYPFAFLGYAAEHWLRKLESPSARASIVNRLKVEQCEVGLILDYQGIKVGIFDEFEVNDFYLAAAFIDEETTRQLAMVKPDESEQVSIEDMSVSGLIEVVDQIGFKIGNPLNELRVILGMALEEFKRSQSEDTAINKMLRQTVAILWLLRDGKVVRQTLPAPKAASSLSSF